MRTSNEYRQDISNNKRSCDHGNEFTDMPARRHAHWLRRILAVTLLGVSSLAAYAQSAVTTLEAETGNNTSAADTFPTSPNSNVASGNVSKVPLRNLLYDGATTKIYAHLVGWFGGRDHIDVGYRSADPAQVQKQVADMISRGIDGVVIDWYGPTKRNPSATAVNTELATQALVAEAEKGPGFEFAIMVDKGALHRCQKNCDATEELVRQMTYIHDTYQKSPAYIRVNGRPVVLFFGVAQRYDINWNAVARSVPGDPILMFQDTRGFDGSESKGGYAWVKLDREHRRNWMERYLRWFYRAGKSPANSTNVFGAVYKGFDDSMASWSEKRVMSQDCGRTWLRTWAAIAQEHSVAEPLQALQLVTWNDYEEGTEIETGIDNCVNIKAWRSGDAVRWRVRWSDGKKDDMAKNGPEDKMSANEQDYSQQIDDTPDTRIDHYDVFVSVDRQNLTKVAELATGNEEFNVASLQLSPGKYFVYVKAVGKPGLMNHMAPPVTFVAPPPQL